MIIVGYGRGEARRKIDDDRAVGGWSGWMADSAWVVSG